MDYPKKILQEQKNPHNFFFIKSFFYIEGENSDFAQGKIVPKMRQDVRAKKNPQNSCSSKINAKKIFLAK